MQHKLIAGGILVAGLVLMGVPMATVFGITMLQSASCVPVAVSDETLDTFEEFQASFSAEEQVEQRQHAELIIAIGVERGFTTRSIEVAVATAIQESNLLNLQYGDRDSLGLYQQRPSSGWGTPAEILTPSFAINSFYDRLSQVENRDERPMMDVAIVVQIPDRQAYASRWKWDSIASDVVAGRAGSQSAITTPVSCGTIAIDGWRAPLDSIVVTSDFGMRVHPVYGTLSMHYGVDFDGVNGMPIYAVADGVVTTHNISSAGLGNYVEVTHSGGVTTGYAHMSAISSTAAHGATVKAGDIVGYIGSTGTSTGNHLHFVVKVNGTHVDPMKFYAEQLGLPLS